ncbi:unnamed protein product [Brassica rapa]|uniref:Uncharacterized protein n=1 Tax=Brassica campestris TaxID=3711 RepID=A0A3P5ZZY5_BRACM|nr:unnamed protein product [Brassica rapa]VDC77528.1 unnamed protein product [Brassica rapa]
MRSVPKVSKVIWKRSKAANIADDAMPSSFHPHCSFESCLSSSRELFHMINYLTRLMAVIRACTHVKHRKIESCRVVAEVDIITAGRTCRKGPTGCNVDSHFMTAGGKCRKGPTGCNVDSHFMSVGGKCRKGPTCCNADSHLGNCGTVV